jgi:hypothetical protein
MELSPWEANIHSATQEFLSILWNTNVHYCFHKNPSLDPILSQMIESISSHIHMMQDPFWYYTLTYV